MATSTDESSFEKKKAFSMEKVKEWFKELCECWSRCCKKDDNDSTSTSGEYAMPKSDLDDLETPDRRRGYPQDTRDLSKPTTKPTKPDPPPPPPPMPTDPPPPPPPMPTEPYKPQLDHDEVHTIENFPFKSVKSSTYEGVYNEVLRWVKPLHYHPRLQSAFLNYALPPKSMEKLELLSKALQAMANAMITKRKPPENKHKELTPILDELSHDPGIRLDQMKSLIIVSESFKEFPRHIVENCIKTLPQDKRRRLIEFISSIPYGTDKRIFTDPENASIFMDPDLQPIMKRIGFSKPAYSSDLVWEASDEADEDRLGLGLFLLAGSHKIY